MRLIDGVYFDEISHGVFQVRWREPRPEGGSPINRKRTFNSRTAAVECAYAAEDVLLKQRREPSAADDKLGVRMTILDALERYHLCMEHATAKHTHQVISRIRTHVCRAKLTYCEDITYESMARMMHYFKEHADHGRAFCSSIKTFLERVHRRFKARIDTTVLLYGKDYEIEEAEEPTSTGAYTDADLVTFWNTLIEQDPGRSAP